MFNNVRQMGLALGFVEEATPSPQNNRNFVVFSLGHKPDSQPICQRKCHALFARRRSGRADGQDGIENRTQKVIDFCLHSNVSMNWRIDRSSLSCATSLASDTFLA